MTNTTWTPAPAPASSLPTDFRAAPAPLHGDGWSFFPASRFAASTHLNPTRAAASSAAAAMRALGHQAWSGRGPDGRWGMFLSTS